MKLEIKILIVGLLGCSLLGLPLAGAQNVQLDSHAVQLQEGKMLTVRVRPGARKIEVVVTGREVANLELAKMGLIAEIQLPHRTLRLTPKIKGNQYVLDLPTDEAAKQLDLDFDLGKSREKFNFKLDKVP